MEEDKVEKEGKLKQRKVETMGKELNKSWTNRSNLTFLLVPLNFLLGLLVSCRKSSKTFYRWMHACIVYSTTYNCTSYTTMTIKDLVATRAIFSANCFLSPCAGHAKQRNKMAILHIYTRFYGRKTHPSFSFPSTFCYCKNNILGVYSAHLSKGMTY